MHANIDEREEEEESAKESQSLRVAGTSENVYDNLLPDGWIPYL